MRISFGNGEPAQPPRTEDVAELTEDLSCDRSRPDAAGGATATVRPTPDKGGRRLRRGPPLRPAFPPHEPAMSRATVTLDRRTSKDRRTTTKSAGKPAPAKPATERRTARRRQIDPTTCERDYSGDELEFMQAIDDYKRRSGRMFPTCSEVLEVLRGLGYAKTTPAAAAAPEA